MSAWVKCSERLPEEGMLVVLWTIAEIGPPYAEVYRVEADAGLDGISEIKQWIEITPPEVSE